MTQQLLEVMIGSPVDYEELTAEILIDDHYIVLIQKEEGVDNMIVEFPVTIGSKVYLDTLIAGLEKARRLLRK